MKGNTPGVRRFPDGRPTPEYKAWGNMRDRCLNPLHPAFPRYGGRGLSLEPAWVDFETFLRDVGPKSNPNDTLERLDNSLGYVRGNVAWRSPKHQARNTRRNRLVTYNGVTRCLAEWIETAQVNYFTAKARLNRGWPPGEALGFETRRRSV